MTAWDIDQSAYSRGEGSALLGLRQTKSCVCPLIKSRAASGMCGISALHRNVFTFRCPVLIHVRFLGDGCGKFYDRIGIICCWLLQGEPGAMGLPGLEGLPGAKVGNPDLQNAFPPMF